MQWIVSYTFLKFKIQQDKNKGLLRRINFPLKRQEWNGSKTLPSTVLWEASEYEKNELTK